MRDTRREVESVVREYGLVAPFTEPKYLRTEDVAAIVLVEFVAQTRLRLVDLAEHVLGRKDLVHNGVGQVNVPLLEVLFNELVQEVAGLALVSCEPVVKFVRCVHSKDLI